MPVRERERAVGSLFDDALEMQQVSFDDELKHD
jgi:hypothetical protein